MKNKAFSVTVLAGGTGSAKFVRGLSAFVPEEKLTVIGNVGDNIKLFGLYVCPDLDTLMYTFAGILDKKRGWGLRSDTFNFLHMIGRYELETWFSLGDRDLATHVYRTYLIEKGLPLSETTSRLCEVLGVKVKILPATDKWVETHIITSEGRMHLQEFWVKREGKCKVLDLDYEGSGQADPAPGVEDAIMNSDVVIVSPANPMTSIKPILTVKGIHDALKRTSAKVLAVSPIIGKLAFSGPVGKIMNDLRLQVNATTVAEFYKTFLDIFLVDSSDISLKEKIEALGMKCIPADIRMRNLKDERRLADFALRLLHVS